MIVRDEVARDVTLLGERARIQYVILGGKPLVLVPPLPRRDPSGWRLPGSLRLFRQALAAALMRHFCMDVTRQLYSIITAPWPA